MWLIKGTTNNEKDIDTGEMLYWSGSWGWVSVEIADLFTDEERNTLILPIGGKWENACQRENKLKGEYSK